MIEPHAFRAISLECHVSVCGFEIAHQVDMAHKPEVLSSVTSCGNSGPAAKFSGVCSERGNLRSMWFWLTV